MTANEWTTGLKRAIGAANSLRWYQRWFNTKAKRKAIADLQAMVTPEGFNPFDLIKQMPVAEQAEVMPFVVEGSVVIALLKISMGQFPRKVVP